MFVRCFTVKRKINVFFSIKTVAQKQQNHIHKPLVGTVYLSENIIEPRKKKKSGLKVSL